VRVLVAEAGARARADKRVEFQTLYQELVEDEARNQRICTDVLGAVAAGQSPLVLTERNDHLDRLERELVQSVRHLVVLRAGMGKKQRQALSERLAAIPKDEARVILATASTSAKDSTTLVWTRCS
jgi:hypothetical protein